MFIEHGYLLNFILEKIVSLISHFNLETQLSSISNSIVRENYRIQILLLVIYKVSH